MAQLVRAPPCHGGGRGFESHPGRCTTEFDYGILAQLGEHLPYKQRVIGSSPIGPISMRDHENAGVAELADAQDLKSCGTYLPYRFDSGRRHCLKRQTIEYVCVAQLDRALGYGPRCREFESSHARNGHSPREFFPGLFLYLLISTMFYFDLN